MADDRSCAPAGDHPASCGRPPSGSACRAVALAPALVEPALPAAGRRRRRGGAAAPAVGRRRHRRGRRPAPGRRHRWSTPRSLATAVGWGCDRSATPPPAARCPCRRPPDDAPLADRFRHLAARAATRVEIAVALARDAGGTAQGRRQPVSRRRGRARRGGRGPGAARACRCSARSAPDVAVPDGQPWIVLDPLDGTGNFAAGLPPWAFSAALVVGGPAGRRARRRPLVGPAVGGGRRRGRAAGRRPGGSAPGSTVVVPERARPAAASPSRRPPRRVRITGCTAIDLCLVADGSAAAWHDVDRSGSHVHDVAGGLAVLLAAGRSRAHRRTASRCVLTPRHAAARVRFVAAARRAGRPRRCCAAARPELSGAVAARTAASSASRSCSVVRARPRVAPSATSAASIARQSSMQHRLGAPRDELRRPGRRPGPRGRARPSAASASSAATVSRASCLLVPTTPLGPRLIQPATYSPGDGLPVAEHPAGLVRHRAGALVDRQPGQRRARSSPPSGRRGRPAARPARRCPWRARRRRPRCAPPPRR